MPLNKSVARTIDLLELLAESPHPLNLTEICQKMSLPKSSAHDLLHTLIARHAVEYDNPDTKTFRLGIKMFSIGSAVIAKNDLYKIAHPVLEKLSAATNGTSYLAIEKDNMIVYLDKVEGESPIRATCSAGDRNYMQSTGLGKALLATHTDADVRDIVSSTGLVAHTDHSITDLPMLLSDLQQTRQRGYAIDDREGMEFLKCIAAPIRNHKNEAVAAISAALFATKLTDDRIEEVSVLVTESAFDISRQLGFTGKTLYF